MATAARAAMPPTRPPRPWLAALLSIPMPGAGMFYAGQRRNGLWLVLAVIVLSATLAALRLAPPTVGTVAGLFGCAILVVLVTVGACVASYIQARRARRNGWPRSSWLPVLALVAAGIAAGNIGLRLPRWVGHQSYNLRMASGSMAPGLPVGTRLFTASGTAPARGSVVVFRPKPGVDEQWVKRIVAVAGDSVQMRAGRLYVNDRPAARDDPAREVLDGHGYPVVPMPSRMSGASNDMPQQTVPPGHLFVLGDDRPNSLDSRFPQIGFVPVDRVDAIGGIAYWTPGEGLRLRPLQ